MTVGQPAIFPPTHTRYTFGSHADRLVLAMQNLEAKYLSVIKHPGGKESDLDTQGDPHSLVQGVHLL